jgi:hypothetical protein
LNGKLGAAEGWVRRDRIINALNQGGRKGVATHGDSRLGFWHGRRIACLPAVVQLFFTGKDQGKLTPTERAPSSQLSVLAMLSRLLIVQVLAFVFAWTAPANGAESDREVNLFLESHCIRCHGEEKQKGKLALHEVQFLFAMEAPNYVPFRPDPFSE